MNVLVAGGSLMAGRTAEALMTDHQVVCLRTHVDVEAARVEQLDVETVIGHPTSPEALRLAHIERTDVFVACTDSDEQNIVACLAAQRMGARRTICVLAGAGFLDAGDADSNLADSLGIDQVVRPGEQLAREITRIVTVPGALDARVFADGRIGLLRYSVEHDAPITRAPLKQLKLPRGVVLVMVRRHDDMILPRGETQLQPGDKVMAMGRSPAVRELSRWLRKRPKREKHRAAIVGAGSVGVSIARGLLDAGWHVTLIEIDRARCEQVSGELGCLVLHGDGADLDLLEQERIGDMPVVVCVTNNDEKNLLVSLLAKGLGVPRIITRADRAHNETMFERVGVDVVLSSRGAAIRSIVQSIDTNHQEIRAVLEHGSACVIELTLPQPFPALPLSALRPPAYAVVGAILRGRQVIVPHGADVLRTGDQVLVFCSTADEDEVREFFLNGERVRTSAHG